MIDIRKLEVFLKVYETRSFSKASNILHLSQPTITLHIKDLEDSLGVSLFNRHTRKVVPSKAGRILYNYGKEVINTLKQMQKELELLKDASGGYIEIGGSTIPGQYILPKIIKEFKENNPRISVFLKVKDSKEVFEKVLEGEFDLGMIGAVFNDKRVAFKPCYEDEIILIGPPNYPEDEVSIKKLKEFPIIKREEGSGTWKTVVEALDKAGLDVLKLKVVGEMGSTEAIKEAVKAGLGFGFISSLAVDLELNLNLIKKIKIKDVEIKRYFYLIYLKNKALMSAEKKFIEFLKSIYG